MDGATRSPQCPFSLNHFGFSFGHLGIDHAVLHFRGPNRSAQRILWVHCQGVGSAVRTEGQRAPRVSAPRGSVLSS